MSFRYSCGVHKKFYTMATAVAVAMEYCSTKNLSGVSFVSSKMARSTAIMKESVAKLKETLGCKIRSVGDDIVSRFEGYKGGHTIKEHVSRTNEELIRRANQQGFDSTSFKNLSSATDAVKHNLRKNADNIEEWLRSSTTAPGVFEVTHSSSIGYGVTKNTKKITYNLTKSRVVLIKDNTVDLGFYIQTSFPIF